MGIIVKQGLRVSIISYLGVGVGVFNILYLYPKFLSPGEVGLLHFLQEAAFVFSSIVIFGLNGSLLKYLPRLGSASGEHGVFNIVFTAAAFLVLFFSLAYWFFQHDLLNIFSTDFDALKYGPAIYVLTLAIALWHLLEAIVLSRLRSDITNFSKEIVLRVVISLAVIGYAFKMLSQDQLFMSPIAAYAAAAAICLIFIAYRKLIKFKSPFFSFSRRLFKEMSVFSVFTFLGLISSMLYSKIDTFMITAMLGVTEFGIFKIPFFIATLIELPKRAIVQISAPLISNAWKMNDRVTLLNIYKKSAINLLIVGSVLFLGVWMNREMIFYLMPNSDEYAAGANIILFIGLARLIELSTGLNAEIINYSTRFRMNLVFAVLMAALMIVANLLLIPRLGIEGAAIATCVVVFLLNFIRFLFVKKHFSLSPFSTDYMKTFIVFGCLWFGLSLLETGNIWLNFFLRTLTIAVIYPLILYLLRVSEELNSVINKLFNVRY